MTSLAERAAQIIATIDGLGADIEATKVLRRRASAAHKYRDALVNAWPDVRTLIEDLVAANERAEADADRLRKAIRRGRETS